jgi:hypothetical protein
MEEVMAGREVELIPPTRSGVPVRNGNGAELTRVTRIDPGDAISSTLMRWEATRHARTFSALAERTRAESEYFDAQTQAIDSYIRRGRAAYRLAELPEILATDRHRRRAERLEELREIEHAAQLAESRRAVERAQAHGVLVDAEQALRAQREHGYLTHALTWKKRHCEVLGVELDEAERKALLKEARNPVANETSADRAFDDLIEQLHARRRDMRADGLDTGKIDRALQDIEKR